MAIFQFWLIILKRNRYRTIYVCGNIVMGTGSNVLIGSISILTVTGNLRCMVDLILCAFSYM